MTLPPSSGDSPSAPSPSLILIVDDDHVQRGILSAICEREGYRVNQAASGVEALFLISRRAPDLILLDVMLPDTNGYAITRKLKTTTVSAGIPIILISAWNERDARLRRLDAGAEDFVTKPVDRAELTTRIRNLLGLKTFHDMLRHNNRLLERQVDQKTQEVRQQCIETVITLTRAAEYRDENTGNHVSRISHYTATLAERLGMDEQFRDHIFYASPMHDIGKLAIPDHILLKPGPLTGDEWEIMKTHTTLGREILGTHSTPYLAMGAQIAQSHHEYWDGSGYPHGLKGEAIPLAARMMTVCDVYDALRSKRPYKTNTSHEETLHTMRHGDARVRPEQFDPEIMNAFFACHDRFEQIYSGLSRKTAGH